MNNTTPDELIQYLITSMQSLEVSSGDAILLSSLLVKLKSCFDNAEV